jgi:hypothetical protein
LFRGSAKAADARPEAEKEPANSSRGAVDSAAVLRGFLENVAAPTYEAFSVDTRPSFGGYWLNTKAEEHGETMSLSNLVGLLQRYAGSGASNTGNVEQDFEKVSQVAPQQHLATGLAEAFRSDQTPPFGQMLSTLFSNSNGQQQAGLLNRLLTSLGPGAASGIAGGLFGGGSQVTPEQAQQVSPETIHQLAEQAGKKDPSIIDTVSSFYAQHPTLVKTLGAGSLALIMSHISRQI